MYGVIKIMNDVYISIVDNLSNDTQKSNSYSLGLMVAFNSITLFVKNINKDPTESRSLLLESYREP